MNNETIFDVLIIGSGAAGLGLAMTKWHCRRRRGGKGNEQEELQELHLVILER